MDSGVQHRMPSFVSYAKKGSTEYVQFWSDFDSLAIHKIS